MKDYAVLRFNGEVLHLTEQQFKQAVADGQKCRCGDCLACACLNYKRENKQ